MLALVLLILALISFTVAAFAAVFGIASTRVHLGWLGAALFTLVTLIDRWPK